MERRKLSECGFDTKFELGCGPYPSKEKLCPRSNSQVTRQLRRLPVTKFWNYLSNVVLEFINFIFRADKPGSNALIW